MKFECGRGVAPSSWVVNGQKLIEFVIFLLSERIKLVIVTLAH